MDFLDPEAKKRRNIRLMIGYVLVGILIFIASAVLVLQTYGFDVDKKTGQVIQNGLLYIDSAPDGAQIYLNGNLQGNQTNARMTIPEGRYDILIQKEGYKDWSRTINLRGGRVERITYPMLVQQNLEQVRISSVGQAEPEIRTQSPDRRWVLVSASAPALTLTEYDLGTLDAETTQPVTRSVALPPSLFTPTDLPTKFSVEEWSTDNRHFLLKRTYGESQEFVIVDRETPEKSININALLTVQPTQVTLRDKKFDQWYIYLANGGELRRADAKATNELVLRDVVAYKTHDESTILYAKKLSETTLGISLLQNDETHEITQVAAGEVQLEISRYESDWHVAVASVGDKKGYVYKNPVRAMKQTGFTKAVPEAIFKGISSVDDFGFSANAQFLMVRSGQNISVFDAEKTETYAYQLSNAVDPKAEVDWMDGHRLFFRSGGNQFMIDFEGSNLQQIAPSLAESSAFFNRDYITLYTLQNVAVEGASPNIVMMKTELRLEADR